MELHLDESQAELLRQILDQQYRDIRYEISNTDNSEFKSELQARRDSMHAILDKVGGLLPDPA